MSLDEGLPGKAQEVLADTLFTLTFSPVQMTGGAGLRTGVFAPATIYIDDVLMTTP
jgi:hypothetical protein